MDSMSGPQLYFLGYICLHLLSLDYFDMKKAWKRDDSQARS